MKSLFLEIKSTNLKSITHKYLKKLKMENELFQT
jgi:hypothetical protein